MKVNQSQINNGNLFIIFKNIEDKIKIKKADPIKK